jgi:hypothetical protein
MPRLPRTNNQTKSENGRSASGVRTAYGTAHARASLSRSRTRRGLVSVGPAPASIQIRRICFARAPLADARIPILDGGSQHGRRFDQGALAGHLSEAAARSHTLRCRAPSQHDRLTRTWLCCSNAGKSCEHGAHAQPLARDGRFAQMHRSLVSSVEAAAESALETRARSTGQDFFSRVAHARTSWTAAEY